MLFKVYKIKGELYSGVCISMTVYTDFIKKKRKNKPNLHQMVKVHVTKCFWIQHA